MSSNGHRVIGGTIQIGVYKVYYTILYIQCEELHWTEAQHDNPTRIAECVSSRWSFKRVDHTKVSHRFGRCRRGPTHRMGLQYPCTHTQTQNKHKTRTHKHGFEESHSLEIRSQGEASSQYRASCRDTRHHASPSRNSDISKSTSSPLPVLSMSADALHNSDHRTRAEKDTTDHDDAVLALPHLTDTVYNRAWLQPNTWRKKIYIKKKCKKNSCGIEDSV